METHRLLPGQDAGQWCTCCDATHVGPGVMVEVWGSVCSGEHAKDKRVRDVFGRWLMVKFFLCDSCKEQM